MTNEELAAALMDVAEEAGRAILDVYAGTIRATRKSDRSPVTAADTRAETIILAELQKLLPHLPIIAEEQATEKGLPDVAPQRFFLVDPLDGTKEFIARNGEFTVNIALVEDGHPVLGIVHLPALGETFAGYESTAGLSAGYQSHALRRRKPDEKPEPIRARRVPEAGAIMAISRSHAERELVRAEEMGEKIAGTLVAGSSLKFCRLAEGVADLYPRFGPTMEWDTAAGHAILLAAGGSVRTLDGKPLSYGKPGFRNPHFIALGRRP